MKTFTKLFAGALMCFGLSLVVSGCGGFSATKSISPLDFFLPGLLKNDVPQEPSQGPAPAELKDDKTKGELAQSEQEGRAGRGVPRIARAAHKL